MSAPSEPEKYSIDEIMDRLKSRPSEESIDQAELVTRADGTQAMRLRRKKRRSHQPHKEELKSQVHFRMLQISGLLILLLLAVFGAGSAIVYANSSLFRDGLAKKIASSSGAIAELQQFRMNPTSANASALTLTWPEDSALESLSLKGIKADIFPISFLGKSMTGREVSATEGTLVLRTSPAEPPSIETPSAEDIQPIRFGHYNTPKFHILIGNPTASAIRLSDSEVTFIPENPTERPQILLTRGQVFITGWPKLRMDRSHIELRGHDTDITSMRLRHETDSKGSFLLSGTISPSASNPDSKLAVQLESFLLSGVVGNELGQLFSGRIDTHPSNSSNFVSFAPGQVPASSLSISFSNSLASTIEVTGFPFLAGLSQSLNDKWFANPVFNSEIRGLLQRNDSNITIDDLNLENKGRMALRGSLAVTPNGQLSGALQVGVAQGMIATTENPRLEAIFAPSTDGFRWLTLKIGGHVKAPTDNFKQLYDSAVTQEASAPTQSIPSFEDLTAPK